MTVKKMLIMTIMNMIKVIMMLYDAVLDAKDDDDADDAAGDIANRKNEIVSVMSYKPVFCRNHANTPVSHTF